MPRGGRDHSRSCRAPTGARSGRPVGPASDAAAGSIDGPSTSRCGRMRSSQPGSHQLASPSSSIVDGHDHHPDERGVDEDRAREPDAEQLDDDVVAEHERQEERAHDRGGGGDDARGGRQAVGDGLGVVAGAQVLLADPRQQEHLVVHREPEQDREHHDRQERLDRPFLADADELLAPAPLEDRDDHAVRGADRQQVHDRGLERHEDRSEHRHQQQEAQAGSRCR